MRSVYSGRSVYFGGSALTAVSSLRASFLLGYWAWLPKNCPHGISWEEKKEKGLGTNGTNQDRPRRTRDHRDAQAEKPNANETTWVIHTNCASLSRGLGALISSPPSKSVMSDNSA